MLVAEGNTQTALQGLVHMLVAEGNPQTALQGLNGHQVHQVAPLCCP